MGLGLLYSVHPFMPPFKGTVPNDLRSTWMVDKQFKMDGRTCQRDIDDVQAQHIERSQTGEEKRQDESGYKNLQNEMHDLKKKDLVS